MEAVKESTQATDHQPLKKCSSNASLSASASGCFDCNICLDFASEPVVTLCGHLYCWPCIYKWLNQSDDNSCDSPQQCPVCKATLSQSDLVPLYGRGHNTKPSHQGLQDIPLRPPFAHRVVRRPESTREARFDHNNLHHRQQHFNMDRYSDHVSPPASPRRSLHFTPPPASSRRSLRFTSGGSLGGMAVAVFPWVFRDREASMQYLSPYDSVSGLSLPRIRRQEMEVERSLHQIWGFLCCCTLLCLLLF